jgi:hypothetical protein
MIIYRDGIFQLIFPSSVLSDVPHLTAKITEMGERIRQLERAVATGTRENAYCHPILATVTRPPSPEQTDEALGSFSVNEDGDAVYFGPIAGSEVCHSQLTKNSS